MLHLVPSGTHIEPKSGIDIARRAGNMMNNLIGRDYRFIVAVRMDDFMEGASQSVYHGILKSLEGGEVIPGQRLTEADLAAQFGVGRNAVREAIQRLSARGVVTLHRNRSASIRQVDSAETDEILDVSGAMTELLFGMAATKYNAELHYDELQSALGEVRSAYANGEEFLFSRARRGIYRVALKIADNRELARLFPAIGTHIINAKYQSRGLQTLRLRHYQKIGAAIAANDAKRAGKLARKHNEDMRLAIRDLSVQQGRSAVRA